MLVATGGAGPDRRGYNAAESHLTPANVANLQEWWTVELPKGSSEPVVADDAVYVTSDFSLLAIGRSSGEGLWSRPIDPAHPSALRWLSAPMVRRDTDEVAVVASTYQAGGIVNDRYPRYVGATGEPLAVLGAAGQLATQRGSRLASTGTDNTSAGSFSSVGVSDRDAGTGWGGFVSSSGTPTLGEDLLYVAGGNVVSAYDPSTPCPAIPEAPSYRGCLPTWSSTLDGGVQPVVIGENPSTLYVGTRAGSLYALNAATGATRWRATIGSPVAQAAALAKGILYVPTDGGSLAALPAAGCGASTCPVTWRGTADGPITAQPAVAGGVVYAGSESGRVTAFDAEGCGAATCSPSWTSADLGSGGHAGWCGQGARHLGRLPLRGTGRRPDPIQRLTIPTRTVREHVAGMALSFGSLYLSGEIGVKCFAS